MVKENRALMTTNGKVVYLKTPLEIQLKRTEKDKKRPLLAKGNKRQILEALKKERDPKYKEIADITIDQNGQKNRTSLINEIIDKLSNG